MWHEDPDIYCFICCGPIYTWTTGSSSRRALSRRRKWVERQRLALLAGEDFDTDASDPEDVYHRISSSDEDIASDDEEHLSYDPELATRERTAWLMDLRVLGFNSLVSGSTKYES
jgi:hypothetical protein